MQNIVPTLITFILAIGWLRTINLLAQKGVLEQKLSRKIVHIGTGPLFVLCWNLFSTEPLARYYAALVPLVLTLQFFAIGTQLVQDPATVQAITRNGNPAEILRGPLYYGLVFIICTVVFWRNSPVGIVALMMMCGGDGLADIIGRRFGTQKLPFNPQKSWAGSAAMLIGSFGLAGGFVMLFSYLGNFQLEPNLVHTAGVLAIISLVATVVEALPFQDVDNLTLTAVVVAFGSWLL